ncbi:MAG: hypothetical protein K8T91_01515 [Planctomycetes bacterium]|nr:hypothetical protein [Planctomycetota bacterium]
MATSPESLEELIQKYYPGGFTVRDEANALVAWAFRNGPLEDLHAGAHSPLLEDKQYSRITDEEMKELMLNACDQVERLLKLKQDDPGEYWLKMMDYGFRYCRNWKR